MDIQAILDDWRNGLTHGAILKRHKVTRAQEFAITVCSKGLSVPDIAQRLAGITDDMRAVEIRAVMGGKR